MVCLIEARRTGEGRPNSKMGNLISIPVGTPCFPVHCKELISFQNGEWSFFSLFLPLKLSRCKKMLLASSVVTGCYLSSSCQHSQGPLYVLLWQTDALFPSPGGEPGGSCFDAALLLPSRKCKIMRKIEDNGSLLASPGALKWYLFIYCFFPNVLKLGGARRNKSFQALSSSRPGMYLEKLLSPW